MLVYIFKVDGLGTLPSSGRIPVLHQLVQLLLVQLTCLLQRPLLAQLPEGRQLVYVQGHVHSGGRELHVGREEEGHGDAQGQSQDELQFATGEAIHRHRAAHP